MPIPLLPALPWVGKALLGLGATLGLYPAIKKTTESAREYVQNTDFPSFNRSSTKSSSGPAIATYEPDNHTNLLITRPISPYIGEEAAPISSLTRTNNWDDNYWSRPSSSWDTDVDYITGDTPAPAPKEDDNDKKGNNNNNNNKNKNNFPWGTTLTILGLTGFTGHQIYQGHKEAEERKENEEVAKKNEQSAAQLGATAGRGAVRRNDAKNDSVPSTSTPGYNSTSSGKSNKPNKPNTYTKFNSDSAYTNKNYANDDW